MGVSKNCSLRTSPGELRAALPLTTGWMTPTVLYGRIFRNITEAAQIITNRQEGLVTTTLSFGFDGTESHQVFDYNNLHAVYQCPVDGRVVAGFPRPSILSRGKEEFRVRAYCGCCGKMLYTNEKK